MSAKRSRPREEPPFEDAMFAWQEWSRGFKDIIFAPMLLRDRRKWMASRELADFRVFSCGHYVAASGLSVARSGLDEGIYIYNIAGNGFYQYGDRTWPVGPGDLLYCFPRTEHKYWPDPVAPWTIHWMHVSGPEARQFEKTIGLALDNPVIQIGIQPEIIYLFNMLYQLAKPIFERRRAAAVQACARLILSRIAICPRSHSGSREHVQGIQQMQCYMERMVDRRLDLDHFAERFGTSPAHFSRVFKRHMHFSPIEYFLRLKMQKACSLLATTRLSVKEVATQLSFEDQNYFSRSFKRIIGMSPRAYRHGILESQ